MTTIYKYNGVVTPFQDLINLAISKNIEIEEKRSSDKISIKYFLNMPDETCYKITQMQYIKSCKNVIDKTTDYHKSEFLKEQIKRIYAKIPWNMTVNKNFRFDDNGIKLQDYDYYLKLINITNTKIYVTF